jgi:SAM-dependent methyltransferase
MWTDVIDLRDFYATPLGQTARRVLRARLRALWPDVKGMNVLGLGYAVPYLGVFRGEAGRVLAAMPASQGVLPWPASGSGLTMLAGESELPLPDLSMDRILLVHALECTEMVRPLMREIWRVLADGGRLIVVVPNRTGLWARFERTPFGHGRPYSSRQVAQLLRDSMFTPVERRPALFLPPVRSRMAMAMAPAFENIGARWLPALGGVLLAEAAKTIYAANALPANAKRAYLPAAERTPGG